MDKPHAIEFKPDGKVMYVIRSQSGNVGVEQFNLQLLGILQHYHMIIDLEYTNGSHDVQVRALLLNLMELVCLYRKT